MMRTSNRGFTLIELMIVVAMIGVLLAIAVPAYNDSVAKARRAQAKADLVEVSQAFERCFTVNNSYDPPAGPGCQGITTGCVLPAGMARSPQSGPSVYYTISAGACTARTFTLTATPTGAQAGDRCANLSITHAGVKSTSSSYTDCW
jgi:type IV pilus assembly protein PilE